MYEDVDIALPKVRMAKEDLDTHSQRLLRVCDLWDQDFTDDQIKRAKRAYYGSVSYVDDCIGRILQTLDDAGLADDTIVIFSGDHGDMLGERGLWYKMSYFESSVRVPLLVNYPKWFQPHRVSQNVSTLDLLPTICDLIGVKPAPYLPMDGVSMMPHLEGKPNGPDTVYAEYTGEGTVRPMMMIRRGPWKYITCPADKPQLFNLANDPHELDNLARFAAGVEPQTEAEKEAKAVFEKYEAEAKGRWNFDEITEKVITSQRSRRLVWDALKIGAFTSWDHDPVDDGRQKYIRSTIPLDDLERKARFPLVDTHGYEINKGGVVSSTRG